MKIKELFEKKRTVMSLEIFPPKLTSPVETIYSTLDALSDIKPDFISVTYGAGGKAKDRTVEIASKIKNDYGIESLAHLTCISSTKEDIRRIFDEMRAGNIENVLALRGDIPEDPDFEFPNPLHYQYACDLVREVKAEGNFCIAAACYPETHIECDSKVKDIKHLKEKVDEGVDFLITQLFFDNEIFYRFMEEIDLAGINVPVSAGIMPVLNKNQTLHHEPLRLLDPSQIPADIDRYEHNPEALKEAGEAYATRDYRPHSLCARHPFYINEQSGNRQTHYEQTFVRKLQN